MISYNSQSSFFGAVVQFRRHYYRMMKVGIPIFAAGETSGLVRTFNELFGGVGRQMAWVYILQSEFNGSFYIGCTLKLEQRYKRHCSGGVKSTRNIRPLRIVFSQEVDSFKVAFAIEKRLKKFKNRCILEKIVSDGYVKKMGP